LLLLGVILFYFFFDLRGVEQHVLPSTSIASLPIDTVPLSARTYSPELVSFWKAFSEQLENARPKCDAIAVNGGHHMSKMDYEPMYHHKPRVDYIDLDTDTLYNMRQSHHYMVNATRHFAHELPYDRETQGIVTTGGGKYSSPLLISLRMLRKTGSKLPVEVFIPTLDEYDSKLCESLLPPLNAKCRILSDVFALIPSNDTINSYQYKVFAILFSSFEDVFFLDADNFPAFNPDSILITEPFNSTGLVTWPDMWAQTSSKQFFEIADVPIPPVTRLSSESGQVLYSKKKQSASLLLATYYNYYGPDHYWPLLSQNAWGQGDKETFLHAALVLNMSFWDVKNSRLEPGSMDSTRRFPPCRNGTASSRR